MSFNSRREINHANLTFTNQLNYTNSCNSQSNVGRLATKRENWEHRDLPTKTHPDLKVHHHKKKERN